MKSSIKAKWVKALRSGKYKQTESSLKDDDAFCCLGVLCNVLGARWKDEGSEGMHPFIEGKLASEPGDETTYLSRRTLRLVGMRHSTQTNLANMNDDGKSFTEIADYIEKRL